MITDSKLISSNITFLDSIIILDSNDKNNSTSEEKKKHTQDTPNLELNFFDTHINDIVSDSTISEAEKDNSSTDIMMPVASRSQEDITYLSYLLENEICENGISNPSEKVFYKLIYEDKQKALNNILEIFYKSYSSNTKKKNIAIGILHMISHLSYEQVYPIGQTIALVAIGHKDIEIAEYGIKCFENWENKDAIEKLQAVHFSTDWLQEYATQVIEDLTERE